MFDSIYKINVNSKPPNKLATFLKKNDSYNSLIDLKKQILRFLKFVFSRIKLTYSQRWNILFNLN